MPERPPIQNKIISYAFQNDCSLDKAAAIVLSRTLDDASMNRIPEGIYEYMFGKPQQEQHKG